MSTGELVANRHRCAVSWINITFTISPPPVLSYSMILVEIATRSDLNSVSTAGICEDHDLPSTLV